MSESVSAPAAAPAAAPAPAQPDSGPAIGGPPRDQPALSISEAARLMRARRTEGEAAARNNGAMQQGEARSNGALQQGEARSNASDDMARALGVPVETLGGAPPADSTPSLDGAGLELDGTRYSHDELRKQISLAQDYTKKTQGLAEQQRRLQAQSEALAQVLPYIQPEIQRLQQAIAQVPAPDHTLIESNPQEYLRQQRRYEDAMREQQRLASLGAIQSEAHQRAMVQQVEAANQQLAREFPQWGDPRQRAAWQADIIAWATDRGGYSHDELRGLTDAKHLRTMIKAMQFDRWVGSARTSAPAQRLAAPPRGVAPPPAPAAQVQQAEAAFDARPNVRKAAALLSARRSNGAA